MINQRKEKNGGVLMDRETYEVIPIEEGKIKEVEISEFRGKRKVYFEVEGGGYYSIDEKNLQDVQLKEGNLVIAYTRPKKYSDIASEIQKIQILDFNGNVIYNYDSPDTRSWIWKSRNEVDVIKQRIERIGNGVEKITQENPLTGISSDYFNEIAKFLLCKQTKKIEHYTERYPKEKYPEAVNPDNEKNVMKLERIVRWANEQVDNKNATGKDCSVKKASQFYRLAKKLIYGD